MENSSDKECIDRRCYDKLSESNSKKLDTINNKRIHNAFIIGSLSSSLTVILFQPLDFIKTQLQLDLNKSNNKFLTVHHKTIGKSTRLVRQICKEHGPLYLWKGTSASLMRSVPGVGLYYSILNYLEKHYCKVDTKPDSSIQAFLFALTARSAVSLILMPTTVTKVQYESGQVSNRNVFKVLKQVFLNNGWLGSVSTILRDSLFSGIYYTCFVRLKSEYSDQLPTKSAESKVKSNFFSGLAAGIVASILTNPLDVIKTRIQTQSNFETRRDVTFKDKFKNFDTEFQKSNSIFQVSKDIRLENSLGLKNFFLGLWPRLVRRTLVAATTWTLYEYFMTD